MSNAIWPGWPRKLDEEALRERYLAPRKPSIWYMHPDEYANMERALMSKPPKAKKLTPIEETNQELIKLRSRVNQLEGKCCGPYSDVGRTTEELNQRLKGLEAIRDNVAFQAKEAAKRKVVRQEQVFDFSLVALFTATLTSIVWACFI